MEVVTAHLCNRLCEASLIVSSAMLSVFGGATPLSEVAVSESAS